MVKVYSASLLVLVENMKNVLAAHGIESHIMNRYLSSVAGEVPPLETWPQLWVSEDDFDRAKNIVEDVESDTGGTEGTVKCPNCGEDVERQFGECWNCGTMIGS